MYQKLVELDKIRHKNFKFNPLHDLNFAKDVKSVPLAAREIPQIAEHFPVVFLGGENPAIITLLSLGDGNLGINKDGKWITPHVPSFLRRYPFSVAYPKGKPEKSILVIDEESKAFSKSKGKQLFKKDGENSELLKTAMEFVTNVENQTIIAKNIAKLMDESGILEDKEISVGEGDDKKILVNGFKVVNKEKLNALGDDVLAEWTKKGFMSLIDAHLDSLKNINTLFNIVHERQS